MFFVDTKAATACIAALVFIFLVIHYTTPPKSWGADVTSGLVYHQIRKYLLRLKTEHVKYWRPQILLFVNDPRRGYKLISFANSLKKGGLFILGHVIVTDNFGASVPEARRQQAAWTQFIDYMKIKAFVNVAISPSIEWGARNIVLSAGLGGMRPNIVMMGFYNLAQLRQEQPLVDVPSPPPDRKRISKRRRSLGDVRGDLPTDTCYIEKRTDIQSYVLTLEDMILKLRTNVALASGFNDLELPDTASGNTRRYIDLWPVQMSAEIQCDDNGYAQSVTTTNFDTYTLILQLGCILNTVPAWQKCFQLRVAVFVEYESEVEEERQRVHSLLESLRIRAQVLVFWLASGDINSYNCIVNGSVIGEEAEAQIDKVLEGEDWWQELRQARGQIESGELSTGDMLSMVDDVPSIAPSSLPRGRESSTVRFEALRRMLQERKPRASFGNLSRLGVSLNMRAHKLDDELLSRHASHPSGSEYSSSNSDSHDVFESDESNSQDESDEPNVFSTESAAQGLDIERRPQLSEPIRSSSKTKITESGRSSKASSKKSRTSSRRRSRALRQSLIRQYTADTSILQKHDETPVSDPDQVLRGRRAHRMGDDLETSSLSPCQSIGGSAMSILSRAPSPSFTSAPIPAARITSDEGQGPSIMFAEQPHPRRHKINDVTIDARSIYQRPGDEARSTGAQAAAGYPSAAAVALSFNDLPCRAQHLILNDLMSQHSDETAVLFTTLPAPNEGTYRSESDSLAYLTDLEVLTQGLGPVLLVHSNSMTVTTNL